MPESPVQSGRVSSAQWQCRVAECPVKSHRVSSAEWQSVPFRVAEFPMQRSRVRSLASLPPPLHAAPVQSGRVSSTEYTSTHCVNASFRCSPLPSAYNNCKLPHGLISQRTRTHKMPYYSKNTGRNAEARHVLKENPTIRKQGK